MAEFCRRNDIDYERMRSRAANGYKMFKSMPDFDDIPTNAGKACDDGYTFSELAEMYSRFRNEEDALDILADFAGLRRGSSAVVRLEQSIQRYLEIKRKEVHGE